MTELRTQEEIAERIEYLAEDYRDFSGAARGDLVEFLTFENAKAFLKPEVTEEQWADTYKPVTLENITLAIKDYMPFAWEKANDCRGLSANRSINHMEAWIWLTADQDLIDGLEAVPYEHYGKEKLIFVCEKFGIDWEALDDGVRTNTDA